MIEEHVHCVSCGKAIETHDEDGEVVEIQGRLQAMLLVDQATGQTIPHPVVLPVCDACVKAAREEAALARSRIVVPGVQAPTNLRAVD